MNKKGMSILSMVLILTALTIGAAISQSYITIEQVQNASEHIVVEDINFVIEGYPEFQNALNYYMNGILKAYMEVMKWTMNYSAQHPEVPYKLILYLFILSLLAPIIIVLVKLIVIMFLLIKEFIQNRKDKKELRRLNAKG